MFPVLGHLGSQLVLMPRHVENNGKQQAIYMDDPKFYHEYGECEVWPNVKPLLVSL